MNRLFLSITIAFMAMFANTLYSQESRYIEVRGSAMIEVDPDIAMLSITLSTEDGATKDIAKSEKLLYNIVDRLSLDAKENLSYSTIFSDYLRRRASNVTKTYNLKVTNLEKIPELYRELSEVGISNISISELKSTRESQYMSDLRVEAVKSARAKANTLAAAAGVNIYDLLSIVDYSNDINYSAPRANGLFMSKSFSESADAVNIDPTKLKYNISVTTKWLICKNEEF